MERFRMPVGIEFFENHVPLLRAHEADKGAADYYPRMLDVIRGLMSSALKTNPYLKFAVITGCLSIGHEKFDVSDKFE